MNIYISMPTGDVTDTFITPESLKKLQEQGTVTRNMTDKNLTSDELANEAKDADIIVCGWGTAKFTKELVARLPKLKIIAYVAGSMTPVVDADALQGGVVALTGNYIFAQSVAEGCLCYTLCALRKIEKYMNHFRNGGWRTNFFENRGLFGKKVGIVGFGEIAKNFVKLIKPFNVEIFVNSGHMTEDEAAAYGVKLASREDIFSECDIVSLHLSMSEKTKGCINRSLLERLKKDAILVNTARGGIVDMEALEELLAEKRFWAALDVFTPEPPDENSRIRKLENTVVLPHMGGPTIDMREYIVKSFAEDFAAYKRNEPMKNLFNIDDIAHMTVVPNKNK